MAKQRRTSRNTSRNTSSSTRRSKGFSNVTSSIETNSFLKGMVKDTNASFQAKDTWAHARNAANNSTDGDVGVIGNEPANLSCGVVPYTIIGAIHLYADQWIIYSTDDTSSEIGKFDDSECKYTTLINDPCLSFNKKHLITGAAKENFDCTWQVYWDDGLNPTRTMNVDDIPYIQIEVQPPGSDCIEYEDTDRLDCERIRLAPLLSVPCVELFKGKNGGGVRNGMYQAYVAYIVNGQRISDYIGVSNLQSLFDHQGEAGSLDIILKNLEKDVVEEYELVLLINNQSQIFAKRIGRYSVHQNSINIAFIDSELEDVLAGDLLLNRPTYEKSEEMYVVNDYLIRSAPTGRFDFNYQPLANQIESEWVVAEVPADYYYKGGNAVGFMRDEVYSFFIRFIYNTGERSASYHIPGRPLNKYFSYRNGTANFLDGEDANVTGPNAINTQVNEQAWEVYNTALPGGFPLSSNFQGSPAQDADFKILAEGKMSYWESTERYPATQPEIWDSTYIDPHNNVNIGNTSNPIYDLCGKPIRHHKMPSEEVDARLHLNTADGDKMRILGVQFGNIAIPVDNDGNPIESIVGYEILRGSRENNKSILAKGIFRNMRKYELRDEDNITDSQLQGVYPNYPYNELDGPEDDLLRPGDLYFHTGKAENFYKNTNRTFGAQDYYNSIDTFPPVRGYTKDMFTFHSPDLMFRKPILNAYETRIYGERFGFSSGNFIPTEKHPKQKLLRNAGAVMAIMFGVMDALGEISGVNDVHSKGLSGINIGYVGSLIASKAPTALGLAPGAAAEVSAVLGVQTLIETLTEGIVENNFATQIVSGGLVEDGLNKINDFGNIALATGLPGVMGGGSDVVTKGTKFKNLPIFIRALSSIPIFMMNASKGGQDIIELIYNFASPKDYAYKFNSHGFYGKYKRLPPGDRFRARTTASNYIGSSFQVFGELNNQVKINNLRRPDTVAIQTSNEFDEPTEIDLSRVTIGRVAFENNQNGGNEIYLNPSNSIKRKISALYGALKFDFANQYGQLENIKQVQMKDCYHAIDTTNPTRKYNTTPIFSGDTYLGRYTEKVIMPIFSSFTKDLPDLFPKDYLRSINVPYPRYWMDSRKYDLSELVASVSNNILNLINQSKLFDSGMPNNNYYLDRHPSTVGARSLFRSGSQSVVQQISTLQEQMDYYNEDSLDPSMPININTGVAQKVMPKYIMDNSYMYTHVNGMQDFFVESEINLAQRDYFEEPAKRFYDIYKYNDLKELFHSDIIEKDNFYLYDNSLSASNFITNLQSSAVLQPRDYDPKAAETCFTYYPKRLIYSVRANDELREDFWRVFLPLNYKDFVNEVTVIKPINKTGAIMLFPYLSPTQFTGVDQLQTDADTKITIGDGGLFATPMQNLVNAETAYEYGSCESSRSVISTPAGVFYISQAQGKIFQYTGQLVNIANQGMKWWFNKYLPSTLIRQFPEFEESILSDNPVVGIGCQSIYDANDDVVYFCKKDYKVKDAYINCISFDLEEESFFIDISCLSAERRNTPSQPSNRLAPVTLGDVRYFEDTSWTVSYDPKSKAWISFHDWHPELTLPSINHFLTTKTVDTESPYCPPGYSYDPASGECILLINETAPAIVDVEELPQSGRLCPSGYTPIYQNEIGAYVLPTPTTAQVEGKGICRKVTCNCPPPPIPQAVTTEYGDCENIYLVGQPNYTNVTPRMCNYFVDKRVPASYEQGGLWRHNVRCDLFVNYYGQDYPWEVELVETHGQIVDTLRSLEYQLESYVYSGDLYNGCADDRWHDLDYNFDEMIIYNTEQVSGLLRLNAKPKNDPFATLNFPQVNPGNIDILYAKEEQKYRINQFYDVTRDRGEFTPNVQETIFNTESNGYIRDLNLNNLDYNKLETEHKKFRHYFNKVLLRRRISADKKMLLKVHNSKLLYSFR